MNRTLVTFILAFVVCFSSFGEKWNFFETAGKFLSLEISASTQVLYLEGTDKYIGYTILPELRLRFFSDAGLASAYLAVGYSGFTNLLSATPATNEQKFHITRIEDTPYYLGGGIAFNNHLVTSAISRIVFNFGYMNVPIGPSAESEKGKFDHGPFGSVGLSADVLSFPLIY